MKKIKCVCKLKKVNRYILAGGYYTIDTRYKMKCSIYKIIKLCLKLNFPFKIGFNDNNINHNMKYIEITNNMFLKQNTKNFKDFYIKSRKLEEKLKLWSC